MDTYIALVFGFAFLRLRLLLGRLLSLIFDIFHINIAIIVDCLAGFLWGLDFGFLGLSFCEALFLKLMEHILVVVQVMALCSKQMGSLQVLAHLGRNYIGHRGRVELT
ncbi:hypothetical protein RRF57_003814 [Xylaria bambusicola]|uniref:Uncharacterized protein n=1 Tax=Xylaria bambusicola TaxID=326684 RepID=A0AAN7UV46_9PEZI